jgi:hypothetical protein
MWKRSRERRQEQGEAPDHEIGVYLLHATPEIRTDHYQATGIQRGMMGVIVIATTAVIKPDRDQHDHVLII